MIFYRCSHAEQELTRMKNLEDGRDDDDDDNDNYSNMDSRTSLLSDYRVGLTHRGGAPLGGLVTPSDSPSKARYGDNSSSASKYRRVKGSGKIISELESIGVRPSASVASAVNFVDSLTFITGRYVYIFIDFNYFYFSSRFSDNFNI